MILRRFMKYATDQNWFALGLDVIVVVFGILIAFQVQEWSSEREQRKQEIAQLNALHADFTENVKRLEVVIVRQNEVVISQRQLLGIIHGNETKPNEDILKVLVTNSFKFYRLEEILGAYDALISSGDLRLIRDRRLRTALAEFSGTLGDGYEDEKLGTAIRGRLLSEMSSSTDLLAVLEPRFRAFASLPESGFDPDFKALLGNREYRNHLSILSFIESGQLHFYRGLLTSAKSIVDIVEQNLRVMNNRQ